MTTNAEIENAATLRVLVRLHNPGPLPIDMWWGSVIDSEMERVFAIYEDEDLRRIANDTIKRLYDAGVIIGELTILERGSHSPHLIEGAALSTRAYQILELVDGDCGGTVGDQAKIALMAANSRAIRTISERVAGFLLALHR